MVFGQIGYHSLLFSPPVPAALRGLWPFFHCSFEFPAHFPPRAGFQSFVELFPHASRLLIINRFWLRAIFHPDIFWVFILSFLVGSTPPLGEIV